MNRERKKGGRHPKLEKKTHHVMLRFNDEEWLRFLAMYEQTEVKAKAVFAKARIFGGEFRVFREDRTLVEYYAKLSSFHAQYRMIGNNYNQTVKELRCHFSEKKAMALLYKLEGQTVELVKLSPTKFFQICNNFLRRAHIRLRYNLHKRYTASVVIYQ